MSNPKTWKKVPSAFQSPSGAPGEPRNNKSKVKVYKLEKEGGLNKTDDKTGKHLKSKSQSNFMATSTMDSKCKKIRNSKVKKYDIYGKNFSSTEQYKPRTTPDGPSKFISPVKPTEKSPARTVSNFHQMKKVIK